MLHHVPHQLELLEEIKRVTKGDILVLEDINDESPCVWYAEFLSKTHYLMFGQSMSDSQYQHNNQGWLNIFKAKNLRVKENVLVQRTPYLYAVAHRWYRLAAR